MYHVHRVRDVQSDFCVLSHEQAHARRVIRETVEKVQSKMANSMVIVKSHISMEEKKRNILKAKKRKS